uniref:Peptidase metallopeptidase domain-containing protein n=1 Tax=Cucumis sativus TaxID=3659 RepID=A0A0A0KS21_CUCSA
MAFKSLQLLFLVFVSIASHVISKHNPILSPQRLYGCRKGDNVEGIRNIKKYLQRYGYLSHNMSIDSHIIELNSNKFDDSLESAIKLYQKWTHLNLYVSGRACPSLFTFSEASDAQSADINISFQIKDHADGLPFDGPGGIVSHAFAPTDGRLHLDGDDSWSAGLEEKKVNVMNAALHELGHVLGLAHSTLPQAVMWPYIESNALKNLNDDDIAGLHALYP